MARRSILALAAGMALLVPAAHGSVLQFATEDKVTAYNVVPGGTLALKFYLYETFDAAGGETAILDDGEGLFSAGLAVVRVGAVPGDPAGILALADIVPNAAFNEPTPTISPLKALDSAGGASLLENRDIAESAGVGPENPAADVRRVLLGTFTFTAGAVAGQTTSFRIADNDAATQDTATWADPPLDLDADIAAFDFAIAVVPEPGALVLLALAALPAIARRRR